MKLKPRISVAWCALASLVVTWLHLTSSTLSCPVSREVQTVVDGYQGYLLDFAMAGATAGLSSADIFNCTVPRKRPVIDTNQHCSPHAQCPLTIENLEDYLVPNFNKESTKRNLCHALEPFRVNGDKAGPKPRIIVFGGSATAGHVTFGCVCQNDNKCPIGLECVEFADACNMKCAWANRLHMWLTRTFPASDVKVLNLAKAGYSSEMMAITFDKILQNANIDSLTANDIIILDHSTNDQIFIKNATDNKDGGGVENLVRLVLTPFPKSSTNSSLYVPPAVILLESVPSNDVAWSIVYRNIAAHYGLILWSWRDVAFSDFSAHRQRKYELWFQYYKKTEFEVHPPWFVHLMWADLIASALLRSIQDCDHWNWPGPAASRYANSGQVMKPNEILPSRLTPVTYEPLVCKDIYVDISAEDEFKHQSSRLVGTVSSANTWQLLEDRPGKFGWIGGSATTMPLIFSFQPKPGSPFDDMAVTIEVTYMRSYIDVGLASIVVCDREVGIVDAMWPPSQVTSFHVSLPYVFQMKGIRCATTASKTLMIKKKNAATYPKVRDKQKMKIIAVRVCHE